MDVSWTASTDDVGVEGYRVYRDGVAPTRLPCVDLPRLRRRQGYAFSGGLPKRPRVRNPHEKRYPDAGSGGVGGSHVVRPAVLGLVAQERPGVPDREERLTADDRPA